MSQNTKYLVTRMTREELPIAIEWADEAGWSPGLYDADCFYRTDPDGFFVGKLNGRIIAVGSAVVYDEHFAFCGFYIVDKAYRGQGYGLALTKERLAYVGQRNAGIDGVTDMLEKYARLGYQLAHHNIRYEGIGIQNNLKHNDAIVPLTAIKFDKLVHYDRLHFPALRPTFLKCWINQPESQSIGYLQKDILCGYGVIRACRKGYKIGPLFADTPEVAEQLFLNLVEFAKGQPIYLDIPECNTHALDLVKKYQLRKVFETSRMYLKNEPNIALNQIYGITSYELG